MTKLKMKKWLSGALVCLCGVSTVGLAHAQSWPTKPIKLIVPYPPGGGTDVIARIVQEPLAKELGQQVIIDNRGGAGGSIGSALAAQSPSDGYTVLFTLSSHTINPAIYTKLPFDTEKDFSSVVTVASLPQIRLNLLCVSWQWLPRPPCWSHDGNGCGS